MTVCARVGAPARNGPGLPRRIALSDMFSGISALPTKIDASDLSPASTNAGTPSLSNVMPFLPAWRSGRHKGGWLRCQRTTHAGRTFRTVGPILADPRMRSPEYPFGNPGLTVPDKSFRLSGIGQDGDCGSVSKRLDIPTRESDVSEFALGKTRKLLTGDAGVVPGDQVFGQFQSQSAKSRANMVVVGCRAD